jgi:hypothetical protein
MTSGKSQISGNLRQWEDAAVSAFVLTIATISLSIGCTTKKQSPQQSFEVEDEVAYDTSSELEDKEIADARDKQQLSIAFPSAATKWEIRKALMIHAQPTPQAINECQDTLQSTAAQADSLRAMTEATFAIKSIVQNNKITYHWCYFQILSNLDQRLELETTTFAERKELFLTRMRELWILSRALDASKKNRNAYYTTFLRKRYVLISQHEFGRNLEVMDHNIPLLTAGKKGKSAQEFSEP